jgi:hypothetical protein
MEICPVGTELFHADGRTDTQTDMTNIMVSFRNFAYPPKNDCLILTFQAHGFNSHNHDAL